MSAAPLDFDALERNASQRRAEFASAKPFPHVVIDDFLPPATAQRVLSEFEDTSRGWDHYHHYNEKKLAITSVDPMGPNTQELFEALQSRRFVDFIERISGVEELVSDPDLDGAGLHKVLPGGFLNVHTDFLSHIKNRHWSRQINLLIYLNESWQPDWNGDLEFWDENMSGCVTSIAPLFNRCVVFHTSDKSYHGHPHPLCCPAGSDRKSLALYYFRDEGQPLDLSSTHYRALPDDPAHKRFLVAADRYALRAYSFLKRYTRLSDGVVSRFLKRF
ncbi:MAG: 2OG-Fe(II) oxygenase [Myxococcota bacterium]